MTIDIAGLSERAYSQRLSFFNHSVIGSITYSNIHLFDYKYDTKKSRPTIILAKENEEMWAQLHQEVKLS